ncbi:MAG: AAA family ATPase [Betaproteobacteria bacterium]|nr:AAA family ATPase [Betaproteobacteria bacterium]
MAFLQSLRLDGLLSFAPGSEAIPLTGLNVLIGPNGSGKSNLIEAIDLLHAAPTGLANAIRLGGGAEEWLWKGKNGAATATIDAVISTPSRRMPDLRYKLEFQAVGQGFAIVRELIEDAKPNLATLLATRGEVVAHYRMEGGKYSIQKRKSKGHVARDVESQSTLRANGAAAFRLDESILFQRKEPEIYPELTWLGERFSRIQIARDYTAGRAAQWRKAQPANQPTDALLPDSSNLALVLNELEHSDAWPEFNRLMQRFLPRYKRCSVKVFAGGVQLYMHEEGLKNPVPAARLSDGTVRFIMLLALLLSPNPPPLICIDEPELGLHPDALSLLANLLVESSARIQIIVTTHSDALVSALTEYAESVLVCEYIGRTVIRRLEAAKLKHWLDKYRLGEIWRIGEIGGNP